MQTKQIHIKNKIVGELKTDYFDVVEVQIPQLNSEEFLVKNIYCSTDPYMRVNMSPSAFTIDTQINSPIQGEAVGEVIDSKNSEYPIGTFVWHKYGWREHSVLDGSSVCCKIDITNPTTDQLKQYLTANSLVGRTAYYSLTKILKVEPGQTIGVDGAMGGVGHLFIQFANIMGVKAYGITSTQEKAQMVNDLGGVGVYVNPEYPLVKKLAMYNRLPDKFDHYHANVGNDYFLAGLTNLNYAGTLCFCGALKHYNEEVSGPGPNISSVIYNDTTIKGCNFFMRDGYWKSQWNTEFFEFLDANRDKFTCINTEHNGIENMPIQFREHFYSYQTRLGKSICKL